MLQRAHFPDLGPKRFPEAFYAFCGLWRGLLTRGDDGEPVFEEVGAGIFKAAFLASCQRMRADKMTAGNFSR